MHRPIVVFERCGRALLQGAALWAILLPLPAATAKPGPAAAAAPASAASAPAARNTLAAIVEASASQDAFEAMLRHHLPAKANIDLLAAGLSEQEAAFAALGGTLADGQGDLAQRMAVFDRMTRLRALDDRIAAEARQVALWADRLDADLDHIARREQEAAGWLSTAQARQAPALLIERLQALPARHAALAQQLRASRDQALQLLERIASLRSRLAAQLAALEARGAVLEERMRDAHAAPLWRTALDSAGDALGAAGFVRTELAAVWAYLQREAALLAVTALATVVLGLLAIRSARHRLSDEVEDPTLRRTRALFDRPWAAALALALFALLLTGPRAPLLFYNAVWALLVLPTALLLRRVLGSAARLSLVTIAVVFASLAALDPLLGPLPMAGRGLHIATYLAVAAALGVDLRHGRLLMGDLLRPALSRRLTQALIVALVLAALASAAGSIGLARTLGHGALGALGFWLVLVVLGHLLYGLGVAVLDAPWAQHIRIVATRGADVRRGLRRALKGAVAFGWLLGMLMLLGLASDLVAWLQALLDADLTVGDATLAIANIVTGVAVLAGTWLGVRLVRLLLEVEILPRLIRRRGVAFALSAVVRYGLVTAGVLLALAAMGIDMTKVTVLAGALGVGIGFGLQSVVNNFFSGLILLVERPVTAGDVVQVDGVQGVVASIGVRSTTVRTPDGAEVIVPNADLISKVVSNWTLSDNRCRIEVEINVPSSVNPNDAIRLLEVAAGEVDGVSERPAPRAWLAGLRDGQRSYRLHAWIADYEAQTAMQSALRLGIAHRFGQEGVALP